MTDLCDLSLSSVSGAIRKRRVSSVEVMESCLARIARDEPKLNAFITVLADKAMDEAKKKDIHLKRTSVGPLHGIPISLKDLYDVSGVRTTGGTKFFANNVPTDDSAVAERLRSAGAIIVGKANMTEFALGGIRSEYGPAVNPWDYDRTPGGSSSGSGVAVSSGMIFGSMGSDTGGSIRIPASFCGVVGLKPTYGRISRRGMMPLSWSLDHAGPLTRTVRDAAMMLQAVAGHDVKDPSSALAKVPSFTRGLRRLLDGMRIGVPERYFFDHVEPEVAKAIDEARRILHRLGARFTKVEIPHADEGGTAQMVTMLCESAAVNRQFLTKSPDDFTTPVRTMFEQGSLTSAVSYLKAQQVRTVIKEEYLAALAEVDALLYPTSPMVPFKPSESPSSIEDIPSVGRCTLALNLAGLPGLSVPCGFTKNGLPIAMQIVGRHFDEARLLRIGHAYEQATDWHTRRPCATR